MTTAMLSALRARLKSPSFNDSHQLLRTVSGTSRFKILTMLQLSPAGLTPTDIARVLNVSLSRVSHQLRILRDHRLVMTNEGSREVVYRIAPNKVVRQLLR